MITLKSRKIGWNEGKFRSLLYKNKSSDRHLLSRFSSPLNIQKPHEHNIKVYSNENGVVTGALLRVLA